MLIKNRYINKGRKIDLKDQRILKNINVKKALSDDVT